LVARKLAPDIDTYLCWVVEPIHTKALVILFRRVRVNRRVDPDPAFKRVTDPVDCPRLYVDSPSQRRELLLIEGRLRINRFDVPSVGEDAALESGGGNGDWPPLALQLRWLWVLSLEPCFDESKILERDQLLDR